MGFLSETALWKRKEESRSVCARHQLLKQPSDTNHKSKKALVATEAMGEVVVREGARGAPEIRRGNMTKPSVALDGILRSCRSAVDCLLHLPPPASMCARGVCDPFWNETTVGFIRGCCSAHTYQVPPIRALHGSLTSTVLVL